MSDAPEALQPADIAYLLVETFDKDSWVVALAPPNLTSQVADQIVRHANQLEEDQARSARIATPDELVPLVREKPSSVVVVSGLESFDSEAWQRLDRHCTSLVGGSSVAFIVDETTWEALRTAAPSVASRIGGAVYLLEEPKARARVAGETREARLTELRAWSGLTDPDVIRSAEARTLGADPLFAEWLILLDRGDLLGDS